MTNQDFESYAEYMGFKGVDSDIFYESYYQLDNDEYEMERELEEFEVYEWQIHQCIRGTHVLGWHDTAVAAQSVRTRKAVTMARHPHI